MSVLPLLIALLPLYQIRLSVLGIPTNLIEILTAVLIFQGLLKPSLRQQWRLSYKQLSPGIMSVILLFVGAAIVSTIISTEPRASLGILKGWIITPLAISWLTYVHMQSHHDRERLLIVLLATGVGGALLGLSQLGTLSRIKSLYDVPASLALWLLPLIVIALWRSLNLVHQRHWFWLSLPMIVALLGTQSLTAALALLATLIGGLLLWHRGTQRKYILFLGLISFMSILAIFTITGKISYLLAPLWNQSLTSSISVRQQLWSVSFDLIKQHPLLGIGLGQFEPHYQYALHKRFQVAERENRSSPLPEFVFRDPHNLILSFWLTTGLTGLLSFTFLNLYVLVTTRGSRNRDTPSETTISQQALFLALISLLIAGLTETTYWKNDLATLHWILFALLVHDQE